MTSKTPLPATLRETFERYGIIKPPTVPPLDKLLEAAAEREMKVELNAGPTVSQAVITAPNHDEDFTQVADSPELAVAAALAMALLATVPVQASLFGDDEPDTPEDRFPRMISDRSATIEETFRHVSELECEESPAGDAALTSAEIVGLLRAAGHNVEWGYDVNTVVDCDTGLIWDEEYLAAELDKIRATAGAR